jgi:hypothetical protein
VFEDCNFATNTVSLHLKKESSNFEPHMILRVYGHRKVDSSEPNSGQRYFDFSYTGESSAEIPLD